MQGGMAHAGLMALVVLLVAAPAIPAAGALGAALPAPVRDGRGALDGAVVSNLSGKFAFVSDFEDHGLDGWTVAQVRRRWSRIRRTPASPCSSPGPVRTRLRSTVPR